MKHFYFLAAFLSLLMVSCSEKSTTPTGISIILSQDTLTLNVNESAVIVATIKTSSTTVPQIEWYSSNPAVVSVNKGVVTGVSKGEATVIATADGAVAKCEVTVKDVSTKSLIKNITFSTGQATFSYDDKDRIREIFLQSNKQIINNKEVIHTMKGFIEYPEGGNAVMVCENITTTDGNAGGERFEYELSLDSKGRIVKAKNVLGDYFSINVYLDANGTLTGKQAGYFDYTKQDNTKDYFQYVYNSDGSLQQIKKEGSAVNTYQYGMDTANEPVNILQYVMNSELGIQDVLINMNIGFPKSNKLLISEGGSERYTYQYDNLKRVSLMNTNQSFSSFYTYVNSGTQTYIRQDPYVYAELGGTTWSYTEYEDGEAVTWYVVFVDGLNFIFIETDGLGFQDMIYGTYSKNGSSVTMTFNDNPTLITTGTISGNALVTSGGYFGGSTYTKTKNLLL